MGASVKRVFDINAASQRRAHQAHVRDIPHDCVRAQNIARIGGEIRSDCIGNGRFCLFRSEAKRRYRVDGIARFQTVSAPRYRRRAMRTPSRIVALVAHAYDVVIDIRQRDRAILAYEHDGASHVFRGIGGRIRLLDIGAHRFLEGGVDFIDRVALRRGLYVRVVPLLRLAFARRIIWIDRHAHVHRASFNRICDFLERFDGLLVLGLLRREPHVGVDAVSGICRARSKSHGQRDQHDHRHAATRAMFRGIHRTTQRFGALWRGAALRCRRRIACAGLA